MNQEQFDKIKELYGSPHWEALTGLLEERKKELNDDIISAWQICPLTKDEVLNTGIKCVSLITRYTEIGDFIATVKGIAEGEE
jgi:hypothetical protein